jgi:hypothetical protein
LFGVLQTGPAFASRFGDALLGDATTAELEETLPGFKAALRDQQTFVRVGEAAAGRGGEDFPTVLKRAFAAIGVAPKGG